MRLALITVHTDLHRWSRRFKIKILIVIIINISRTSSRRFFYGFLILERVANIMILKSRLDLTWVSFQTYENPQPTFFPTSSTAVRVHSNIKAMTAHNWRFNRTQIWYELFVCKTAEKYRRLFWNMNIFKQTIVEVVLLFGAHATRDHYRFNHYRFSLFFEIIFFLCMNPQYVYPDTHVDPRVISIELEVGTHNRERSYIRQCYTRATVFENNAPLNRWKTPNDQVLRFTANQYCTRNNNII